MKFILPSLLAATVIGVVIFYFTTQTPEEVEGLPQNMRTLIEENELTVQSISFNADEDVTTESENGTIIVAEKGAFLDKEGNEVTGMVQLKIIEVSTIEELMEAGINLPGDGLTEMAGLMYIQPIQNGEPLNLNPEKPLYIDIPTADIDPDMMVFHGDVGRNGDINWTETKKPENYLINIPFEDLDFLPDGFPNTVRNGLPFRGHKVLTEALVDSLFYSLSASDGSHLIEGFEPTNLNEPYYTLNSTVIDWEYTRDSYVVQDASYKRYDHTYRTDMLVDMTIGRF